MRDADHCSHPVQPSTGLCPCGNSDLALWGHRSHECLRTGVLSPEHVPGGPPHWSIKRCAGTTPTAYRHDRQALNKLFNSLFTLCLLAGVMVIGLAAWGAPVLMRLAGLGLAPEIHVMAALGRVPVGCG